MDNLQKKLVLCLVMAVFIVVFLPFYWAREPARQDAAVARIERESVQKGNKTFLSACGACHGQQGQGGVGPALKGADATLMRGAVRTGKGIMPRFGPNQISDRELEDIIVFLNSLTSIPKPATPVAPATPAPSSPAPTSPIPVTTLASGSPAPAPPVPTTTASSAPKGSDLVSKGEELYQRTGGGTGCAVCHGSDGYGNIGPSIRGSSTREITDALKTVTSMNFMKMTDDEAEAVSAYLKYLESQR